MVANGVAKVRWYGSQVLCVASAIALGTYVSAILSVRPSPWNALWMLGLPIAVGLAGNRGTARAIMAGVPMIVSWVVASLVGTALGGL